MSSGVAKRKLIAWLCILAGIGGMAYGTIRLVQSHRLPAGAPHGPTARTAAPSSTKPTAQAVAKYTVAPDLPKYIEIPAINVPRTRVIQLGLTKNNQIASPGNIYDAGWYKGSAKPGGSGASFIFGHLSSWTAKGAFYNLAKLHAGDKLYITRGDGTRLAYEVVGSHTYAADKVDMDNVLSSADPKRSGLNLMTCAGKVIAGTSDFGSRLVVFSVLVSR